MTATRKVEYGGHLHRIANKPVKGTGARVTLMPDHPAIREARTLFPSRVVHPDDSPRLLVSGFNQRKIGGKVTKGRWKGLPLYTLTLEERATCPRSCGEWTTCYGNNMNWSRRHAAGLDLEARLIDEVVAMEQRHPGGFAVRLHVLGDFYSVAYARLWQDMLAEVPGLHVFGFTARQVGDPIARVIRAMNAEYPDRCVIRTSGVDSLVIASPAGSEHVLCPVQTGKTDCCGLCWTMDRPVEFVRH
ncbi:hypothetical protein [Novosphingobium colocasiae]|uniref:GP88 family protein n=1 Tax=Novosphingobium colocasiae TaxID=1256513 RepID=UPI0035B4AA49